MTERSISSFCLSAISRCSIRAKCSTKIDWTCVARSKNKLAGRAITLERSLSLGHVETMLRVGGMVFGDSF